ncbi:MAG: Ig-like domain-containing protein [Eubacteriaceae bacterium]|nr:Ig-like domain-containing protein [Eubacteriaceae bacterium]
MKRFIKSIAIMIVLSLMVMGGSVLASGSGTGSGSGSGGGSADPLKLESSTIANNEKNVETGRKILLVFSKNVVNMSVRDSNMSAFSMTDETGNKVSINVVMVDDNVDPERRNDVIIQVVGGLQTGKTYALKIGSKLESKSGDVLGAPVTITFSTVAAAVSQNTATANKAAASTTAKNPKTGDQTNIVYWGILAGMAVVAVKLIKK